MRPIDIINRVLEVALTPRRSPRYPTAVFNRYRTYQNSACDRKLDWNLTVDEVAKIVLADCHYCGVAPEKTSEGRTHMNGIDRVDNKQGYQPGNSVPCCKLCNRMKSNTPLAEFMERVHRIAMRHPLHPIKELTDSTQ